MGLVDNQSVDPVPTLEAMGRAAILLALGPILQSSNGSWA